MSLLSEQLQNLKNAISSAMLCCSEMEFPMVQEFVAQTMEQLAQGIRTRTVSVSHMIVSSEHIRVYVDGCYDLMHSGHYNVLRQAKKLFPNCTLVAGVHSCEEIRRNKGPPVMTNEERCNAVAACKWVDEVVFDTPCVSRNTSVCHEGCHLNKFL
jgi:cytidyltransferase-like protein